MDALSAASRFVRQFEFSSVDETDSASSGSPVILRALVPEVMNRAYGLYTWPAAPVLAQYIFFHRAQFSGANVLELGAGTALPSIIAAQLGARCVVTDCARSPQLLANCQRALEMNQITSARVLGLSWGLVSPALLALPPQDFIIGSDVFYDEPLFEDVLRTVAFLLERGRDRAAPSGAPAQFIFTYQERSADRCLEPLLQKWRLSARMVPLSAFAADRPTLGGSDLPGNHSVQLYVVTELPPEP